MNEGTAYLQFSPPEWPPSHPISLQTISKDGVEICLLALEDGHFAVRVATAGAVREAHFQRVTIETGHFYALALAWGQDDIRLFSAGIKLLTYTSNAPPIELAASEDLVSSVRTVSVTADVLQRANREEWLFLMTLRDLSTRLANGQLYDLVRASALVRQLLFDDGEPLVHAANRGPRARLRFDVVAERPLPDGIPEPETHWCTLYPQGSRDEIVSIPLAAFLGRTSLRHEGVSASVRDVVAAVAHVFGGVHLGRARDDESMAIAMLRDRVIIADQPMVFSALKDIARVTIEGLLAVVEAIASQYPPTPD
jgi:hypothetical protein